MHEPVTSFRKVSVSSNRKFGFAFAGLFLLLGVLPWVFHHGQVRWPLLVLAIIFALAALFLSTWLAPLNRAWFKLGMRLNKILNPIFMGLMFYGAIVPFGFFLRGKDLLRLSPSPARQTYWILRNPPGPSAESLKKQF